MTSWRTALFALALASFAFACGDDDGPTDANPADDADMADAEPDVGDDGGEDAGGGFPTLPFRAECENLNPNHCMMPWPSSFYLEEDSTTETGFRVNVPSEAFPLNKDDDPASTDALRRFDGFSAQSTIMTLLRGPVDESLLVAEPDIAASLDATSTTVLLDAESGELVAHFAEQDGWPMADPERRTLYIRPAQRLQEDHRYIVAVQGLTRTDGSAIEASEYFASLRDESEAPEGFADLEGRRERFEDIFSALTGAGVERAGLIEAWEFHTGSGASHRAAMVEVRDATLVALGEDGLGCTIVSSTDDPDEETARMIEGTVTAPLFMVSDEKGAAANWVDGSIEQNGTVEIPFWLKIPTSAVERLQAGEGEAPVMVFGHGLLQDGERAVLGGASQLAKRMGVISVGTNWVGLSDPDQPWIVSDVLTQFEGMTMIPEQLVQAQVNTVSLARSIDGVCRDLPELQVDEQPIIKEDERYFLGISFGGIMGTTFAAMTPDIERFVLQVPGVSMAHIMRRSSNFDIFEQIFFAWYLDNVDREFLLGFSQILWDIIDPATYAPHLLSGLEGLTEPKRVLYQVSEYDLQVCNESANVGARTIGLPALDSSIYVPEGLDSVSAPVDSAFVSYNVGVSPIRSGTYLPRATAEDEFNAHLDLKFMEPAQAQIEAFFQPDGMVEDFCDETCDPSEPRVVPEEG